MRYLFALISLASVGCAHTPYLYSPELEIAQRIYNADKIEVVYNGKNGSYTKTASNWPEAFKFLGHSIQDGK
jgi:hypothetical protein